MSISCNVSKCTLKQLSDINDSIKNDILFEIWDEYLRGYIDYNSFNGDFIKKKGKNKRLSKKKKIVIINDEDRCQARVWKNIDKTYVQCNKTKDKDSDLYCCLHLDKQNYGTYIRKTN